MEEHRAAGDPAGASSRTRENHPMAKVLVLYYSSYGHVEQMAYAVAEGAREAGAEAVVKRVPELVPEEVGPAESLQARSGGADRHRGRTARLRRDHLRDAHPLRQHGRADEAVHRPDRRALDEGRAGRQGRFGLHLHRLAARRPGDDPDELPHGAAPPRHGGGRAALRVSRGRPGSRRSRAARPTAPPPSRTATARASPAPWSSRAPASRAATSPGSRPSSPDGKPLPQQRPRKRLGLLRA